MAPEHYKRERADARSDQFSFCVSLYRALYGEHPYMDRPDEELALAKYEGRVREAPRGSQVPAWLREVVLRGLAPNPEDRWPSMDALLHALGDDPRVRRRRWLLWGAAFASIALAAGAAERYVARRTGRCHDVEQHLAGIWDPGRKAAIRAAFERTHLPYAASAWASVERLVDGYVRSWSGAHQEACEATWVHGEQSEDVFELRLECLKRRLGEVRALGELFVTADAKVVEQAVQMAGGLPALEGCSDVRALRTRHAPPEGRAAQERLARIEAELARVRALGAAGKYREGLPQAEGVVTDARALGYEPLLGQALWQLGDLRLQSGDIAAAERSLEEAILRATAAGDEETAVEAEMALGWLLGVWKQDYVEGGRWTRLAVAGNAHLGDQLDRKAKLENSLGVLHWQEGSYDEALAAFQRSLAAGERAFGEAHPWVATSQANLGVLYMDRGEYEAALTALGRARSIQEKTVGEEHPLTSFSLSTLCEVHRNLGELDVALAHGQKALALRERLLGEEHPAVAVTLDNLGLVNLDRGEYAAALGQLDRALHIREKHFGKDHPWVAATLDRMGEVYRASRQYPQALAAYQRALDIRTQRLGKMHPDRAEVLSHLGLLQLAMGHAAEARQLLAEAYEIQRPRRLAPQLLGRTRFGLAQALWMTDGDRRQARELADAALEDFGKLRARRKERDEVAAWLTQHPQESSGSR
jgi:tetratricopeptide (TPR) repeat protein